MLVRTNKGPTPEELGPGKAVKSGPLTEEETEDQGCITGTWQSRDTNSGSQNPDPGSLTTLLLPPRARLDLHV